MAPHFIRFGTVLLALLVASVSRATAWPGAPGGRTQCFEYLASKVALFSWTDPRDSFERLRREAASPPPPNCARCFLGVPLGTGQAGTALLVRDDAGAFEAIKLFHLADYDRSARAQAASEAAARELLSRAVARADGRRPAFVILRARLEASPWQAAGEPDSLRMPFVPGRGLDSVLADPALPDELRVRLRADYERRLDSLAEALREAKSQDPDFVYEADARPVSPVYVGNRHFRGVEGLRMLVGWIGPRREPVIVKPDNVIVDPYDLRMTLVDPN